MADCARNPVLFPVVWFVNETTTEPLAGMFGITKLTTANFSEPSGQRFFTSHCVNKADPLIEACAKLAISPCANAREIEMGRFVCPEPVESVMVTLSPAGGGGEPVGCDTTTVTPLEVALFPLLSVAVALSVCDPLPTIAVSHETE